MTKAERRAIYKTAWEILENQGIEIELSPQIKKIKISQANDGKVAVELSAVEMGPYEYNCNFIFDLATRTQTVGSARCSNSGTKIYPKIMCEDEAIAAVKKVRGGIASDLQIFTRKLKGSNGSLVRLSVDLVWSYATNSESGEATADSYSVALDRSDCSVISVVKADHR